MKTYIPILHLSILLCFASMPGYSQDDPSKPLYYSPFNKVLVFLHASETIHSFDPGLGTSITVDKISDHIFTIYATQTGSLPKSNIIVATEKGFYNINLIYKQDIDQKEYHIPITRRINIPGTTTNEAKSERAEPGKQDEEINNNEANNESRSSISSLPASADKEFIHTLFDKDRSRLGKRDGNYKIRYYVNNLFEDDSLYYIGFAIENIDRDPFFNKAIAAYHLLNININEVERKTILSRKERRKLPETSKPISFQLLKGERQFQANYKERYTVVMTIPKVSLQLSPGDYLKFIFIEGNDGIRSLNLIIKYSDFIKNLVYI